MASTSAAIHSVAPAFTSQACRTSSSRQVTPLAGTALFRHISARPNVHRPAGLRSTPLWQARKSVAPPAAASSDEVVFGMDTSEGLFGFTPFAELWVGRLAMMGFLTSVVEEGLTGQGTLQQIGLTPSVALFVTLLAVFGGATLVGTGATIKQYNDGAMSDAQLGRVRSFLRLGENEAAEVKASARELKTARDPIRYGLTDDVEGIEAARSSSTPADEFLGDQTNAATAKARSMKEGAQLFAIESTSEADATADMLKSPVGTSVSLSAKDDILEQSGMASSELAYAKEVEMRNGRYAMVGFLAAVLVESATGHGIIQQLIDICKLTGLLGAESGF